MEAHVKPIRVAVNLSNVKFQNLEIMKHDYLGQKH